jgi:hypothetical protein
MGPRAPRRAARWPRATPTGVGGGGGWRERHDRAEPNRAARRAGAGRAETGTRGREPRRGKEERGEAGGMERTRGERGCARAVGEDVGGAGKMPLARGPRE